MENLVATATTFSTFVENATSTLGGNVVTDSITGCNWSPNGGSWIYWYPYPSSAVESKVEKAYAIVRALMKAKVVQVRTLARFFATMDEVVKVL